MPPFPLLDAAKCRLPELSSIVLTPVVMFAPQPRRSPFACRQHHPTCPSYHVLCSYVIALHGAETAYANFSCAVFVLSRLIVHQSPLNVICMIIGVSCGKLHSVQCSPGCARWKNTVREFRIIVKLCNMWQLTHIAKWHSVSVWVPHTWRDIWSLLVLCISCQCCSTMRLP